MIRRIPFAIVVLFLIVGPWFAVRGAEPVSPAAATEPTIVETPALPYLTLFLARDPTVHAELKIAPKQASQIEQAIALVDHSFWVLRDVPVAKCGEKLDALLQQLRAELNKTFSKQQSQRFDEIVLQARGVKSLVSPELVAQLNLSDDQVSRIRQLLTVGSAAPAKPPAAAAKGKSASKANTPATPASTAQASAPDARQILAVLKPEQSSQLSQLTGGTFDLSRVRQIGCVAPELPDVSAWINSDGFDLKSMRGQVVALHFWAFGCINCVRNLPHYQSWYDKFSKTDLTILGIHTPETESERSLDNLKANVKERGIQYPVVFDAASETWKAWGNNMWPSVYLIDKRGQVRYWWYGELNWEGAKGEEFMRQKIAELIAEK